MAKGELRYVTPPRSPRRRVDPPQAFREIARAEGFVLARCGDDLPWVFEVAEWNELPPTPDGHALN